MNLLIGWTSKGPCTLAYPPDSVSCNPLSWSVVIVLIPKFNHRCTTEVNFKNFLLRTLAWLQNSTQQNVSAGPTPSSGQEHTLHSLLHNFECHLWFFLEVISALAIAEQMVETSQVTRKGDWVIPGFLLLSMLSPDSWSSLLPSSLSLYSSLSYYHLIFISIVLLLLNNFHNQEHFFIVVFVLNY